MSIKQGGNTIAGGGTVDQTYDGTSTNAQSGTAVAGAISNMVTTDTAQTISGQKNFTENVWISKTSGKLVFFADSTKGTPPADSKYYEILVQQNGTSTTTSTRYACFSASNSADGSNSALMAAYKNASGSSDSASIKVTVFSNGTINTNAPAVTNTNGIVTQTGMSAGTNGYLKFGNGYIIQWGYASNVAPGYEVSFPTPFSSTNYSVVTCARYNAATGAYAVGTYSESSTSFKVSKASSGNGYFKWVAFGK